MSDIVEARDRSKLEQCEERQNVRPKRPLSQILRPQAMSDLTLPTPIIDRLQKMIETDSIMDMLFYGKVGTGKTSAARLFEDSADPHIFVDGPMFLQWDGSSVKDVAFIRKDMKRGLGLPGFIICFLDRADLVPKAAQQAIPSLIDDMSHHCRFLLAVNDRSKIIPEIRSRLMPICFDIEPSDREEVQKRLIDRYESKLAEYEILHDKRRLTEIIGTNYPDLRSIAKEIEFEFA
jgi:DNA polymerase III delta prime subunit